MYMYKRSLLQLTTTVTIKPATLYVRYMYFFIFLAYFEKSTEGKNWKKFWYKETLLKVASKFWKLQASELKNLKYQFSFDVKLFSLLRVIWH